MKEDEDYDYDYDYEFGRSRSPQVSSIGPEGRAGAEAPAGPLSFDLVTLVLYFSRSWGDAIRAETRILPC